MEPRLIYVLISIILIHTVLIYCHPTNSSLTPTINHTNSDLSGINNTSDLQDWLQWPQSDGNSNPLLTHIRLGYPTSHDSPCATILTMSHCLLEVPTDEVHYNIPPEHCTFLAAKVENECSLTIKDYVGSYSVTGTSFGTQNFRSTVDSVCCECHGCRRIFPQDEQSCALLFEEADCSLCNGFRLWVEREDMIGRMHELVDNKVSSLYVFPGCELIIYKGQDFTGDASLATGSMTLPYEWNDIISSYNCTCNASYPPTPIPPTTSRPTTLPTTISDPLTTAATTTPMPPATTMAQTETSEPPTTAIPTTTIVPTTLPPTTTTPTTTTSEPPTTTTSEPPTTTNSEPPTTTASESLTTTTSEPYCDPC